jgi:hypothetical protein
MSSALVILVAVSTAAGVIILTLLVSKLLHSLVDSTFGPAALPGLLAGGPLDVPSAAGEREVAAQPKPPAPEERAVLADNAEPVPFAELLMSHVKEGRSEGMKEYLRSKVEQRAEPRAEQRAEQRDGSDEPAPYMQLGKEVTAVLIAAEQAAEEIRENAKREAHRIEAEAKKDAAATIAEAQAQRAAANSYGDETRAGADAYAEKTRRTADKDAARAVAQAAEHAKRIVADAERKATELEAEAERRKDDLERGSEEAQDRIETMLAAFRSATGELEALLHTKKTAEPVERVSDELMDEAVKRASARSNANMPADS